MRALLFLILAVLALAQPFPPPATPGATTAATPPAHNATTTTTTTTPPPPPPRPPQQPIAAQVWTWVAAGVALGVGVVLGFFIGMFFFKNRLDPFVEPFLESKTVAIAFTETGIESFAIDERNSFIGVDNKRGAIMPKFAGATPFKTKRGTSVYTAVKVGNYLVPTQLGIRDLAIGLVVADKCRDVDTIECAELVADELAKMGGGNIYKSVPLGNFQIYVRIPREALSVMLFEKTASRIVEAISTIEAMHRGLSQIEPKMLEYYFKLIGGFVKSQSRAFWIVLAIIIILVALGLALPLVLR